MNLKTNFKRISTGFLVVFILLSMMPVFSIGVSADPVEDGVYPPDYIYEKGYDIASQDDWNAALADIGANYGATTSDAAYVVAKAFKFNLTDDVTISSSRLYMNVDHMITVNGNGHSIFSGYSGTDSSLLLASRGILNLYDVTIDANGHVMNDCPGAIRIEGTGAVLNIYSGTTISNFKNGPHYGAGVAVGVGKLNMYGGSIENNVMRGCGGGVYVGEKATFNMYGGKIVNNAATHPGGNLTLGSLGGGVYSDGKFYMYGGEISGNTACSGGGVAISNRSGSTFVMRGGVIENNKALSNGSTMAFGGGVCFFLQNYTALLPIVFDNPTITPMIEVTYTFPVNGETPSPVLGTLSKTIDPATNPGAYLVGGEIRDNYADTMGGGVGAFYLNNSYKIYIGEEADHYITIKGNESNYYGDSYGGGIGLYYTKAVEIDGALIEGNAACIGGGLYLEMGSNASVKNSILSDNIAVYGGGIGVWNNSYVSVNNSDIIGNAAWVGGGVYAFAGSSSPATCFVNLYDGTVIADNYVYQDSSNDGGYGGGVYVEYGPQNATLTGNAATQSAKFNFSGAVTVQDNYYLLQNGLKLANDVYVASKENPIHITGALTGSKIGIVEKHSVDEVNASGFFTGVADSYEFFTYEYSTPAHDGNNGDINPATYFFSDDPNFYVDWGRKIAPVYEVSEQYVTPDWATGDVYYSENVRNWSLNKPYLRYNPVDKKIYPSTETTDTYQLVFLSQKKTGSSTSLDPLYLAYKKGSDYVVICKLEGTYADGRDVNLPIDLGDGNTITASDSLASLPSISSTSIDSKVSSVAKIEELQTVSTLVTPSADYTGEARLVRDTKNYVLITFDAQGGEVAATANTGAALGGGCYEIIDENGNMIRMQEVGENDKTFPTADKENMFFLGWADADDATAPDYLAGATYEVTGEKTYYAVYEQGYRVTYDANEGEGEVKDDTLYHKDEVVTVKNNAFTRDGYTFMGWNTAADGSGTDYAEGATFAIAADVTLYAQWAKDLKVFYNANGGSGEMEDTNIYHAGDEVTVKDNEFTAPNAVSVFKYWTTEADGTGTKYNPGDTFTIGDEDVTLYAQWTYGFELKKTYIIADNYENAGDVITDIASIMGADTTVVIEKFNSFNRQTGWGAMEFPDFAEASYTIPVADGVVAIQLPADLLTYGVGDYWYKVTEQDPGVAGVTLDDTNPRYLHIQVTWENPEDPTHSGIIVSTITLHNTAPNDDGTYENNAANKTEGFTNKYGAGNLEVVKLITGNMADPDKLFKVTVTFAHAKNVESPITYSAYDADGNWTAYTIPAGWTGETPVEFYVKGDTTVTFENIPDGMSYTVVEDSYVADGYETTYSVQLNEAADVANERVNITGTITDSEDRAVIVNDKTVDLDVGVILNNKPYFLLMIPSVLLAVALFIGKRKFALDVED